MRVAKKERNKWVFVLQTRSGEMGVYDVLGGMRACVCSVVYALARWLDFVCIRRVHAESTLPWEWRNRV